MLLQQVRAVHPRGHHEWERVVANYNQLTGEDADYDRLKEKFFKLVRTVKPTGRNTKPTHVTLAQEINAEIEGRVYAGLGDGENDDDAIDRAALHLSLSNDEKDEKEEAAPLSPPASSSSSPPPRPPPSSDVVVRRVHHSFPSDRTSSSKRAKPNAEVTEVVQALSATLSTAISAQMEQTRVEAKLAREQMALQQQQLTMQRELMTAQLLQQQQSMAALITALANK